MGGHAVAVAPEQQLHHPLVEVVIIYDKDFGDRGVLWAGVVIRNEIHKNSISVY